MLENKMEDPIYSSLGLHAHTQTWIGARLLPESLWLSSLFAITFITRTDRMLTGYGQCRH